MKQINIKEALNFAWEMFKKHAGFLIGLSLLTGALYLGMDYAGKTFKAQGASLALRLSTQLLFLVFGMLLSIGITKTYLRLHDGQDGQFSDLYSHSNLLWKYFVGQILYGLIVLGGLILLVVPGIIWAFKYMYTETLIIDREMDPFAALKKSAELTKDIKLQLVTLFFVQIGLFILGFIALGIGLFVALPVMMFMHIHIYKHLLQTSQAPASVEAIQE